MILTQALKYENNEKPGSYMLAIRADKAVLNPGEEFILEHYITGYGRATGLKMVHYPSSDIYDFENSYVEWNLTRPDETGKMTWGAEKTYLQPIGTTLFHGDYVSAEWNESSAFVDLATNDNRTTMIISEQNLGGKSPYQYTFRLKKDAPPGVHKLHFYMTYYNGESWQCSASEVEFRINNSFEKNSTLLSSLAFFALVITISKDGLVPVVEIFKNASTTVIPSLLSYISL
jgi:hypothetical protein